MTLRCADEPGPRPVASQLTDPLMAYSQWSLLSDGLIDGMSIYIVRFPGHKGLFLRVILQRIILPPEEAAPVSRLATNGNF
jgi:hypothetical protein